MMNNAEQHEALILCKSFIESLPEEITWVKTHENEDETKTIGRDFILSVIEELM